jgi:hypothetical protein
VVPVWNETTVVEGRVRSTVVVTPLNYALQLLTEVAPLTVRSTAQHTYIVKVPAASAATLAALSPRIQESSVVRAPVATISITAGTPVVPGNSWHIRPPAAGISISASAPTAP